MKLMLATYLSFGHRSDGWLNELQTAGGSGAVLMEVQLQPQYGVAGVGSRQRGRRLVLAS